MKLQERDSKKRIAFPIQLFAEGSADVQIPDVIPVVSVGKWDHPAYGEMEIKPDFKTIADFRRINHKAFRPVFQQEIADHLGLTLVHVNRVLRRLRESGIVTVRRGVVTIDEMARLSQLAAPMQDIYERETPEFGGQAASP
jgi:Crp-like helix-turn-helix domain